MFDNLAAYFYENLAGSYTAYLEVRNNESYGMSKDLRAGISAATALYHAREHLPKQNQKTRQQIAKECPEYGLLGDITNVAKHKRVDRNNPQITSAEQIAEVLVSTLYEDEEGLYQDVYKEVTLILDDGTRHYLSDLLTEVINYWGDEFVRLGIIESYKPFPPVSHSGNQYVSREDAKGTNDIEMMGGVRFQQTILFLRYNAKLEKAEPILAEDIKRMRVVFYKPSHAATLTLDLKLSSGEEYSISLDSTAEESEKWRSLKTDEERQEFVDNLFGERAEEIDQLLAEAIENKSDKSVNSKELRNAAIVASGKVKSV